MEVINILDFDVYCSDPKQLVDRALLSDNSLVINTINPHSYVEQKSDSEFRQALKLSDYLIPDGSGIVLGSKCIHGVKIKKIAGFDLFEAVMQALDKKSGKVFFLGSTDIVLDKIKQRGKIDYPDVKIGTLSPPFKAKFEESDIEKFAKSINAFNPDVVFVGLTAPKQEKLIALLTKYCSPKIFSGIGAVFDFYAGTVKRPSSIWLKLHLEWLVRFLGEPKRLWKRNFVSAPIFLKDIFFAAISARIKNKKAK